MSTSTKDLADIPLNVLEAEVKSRKATEIANLQKEIADYEELLHTKKATLAVLTGKPIEPKAKAKRGRKPGGKNKAAKVKKGKAKRGAVGGAITAFVSSKGKSGAKVSEIAAATGFKPANITAFFYAKGNVKKFKKMAPATFTLK